MLSERNRSSYIMATKTFVDTIFIFNVTSTNLINIQMAITKKSAKFLWMQQTGNVQENATKRGLEQGDEEG